MFLVDWTVSSLRVYVTSKLNVFFLFTVLFPCIRTDIMNLKDCAVGFSDSLVLPQRSWDYLGHGGEGSGGKGIRRSVVPTSRSYADSSDWTPAGLVRIRPRGQNNGASEKWHGPEVDFGPSSSISRFSLDFRESKPTILSLNSFSTMAEITPHHYVSLLVGVGEPVGVVFRFRISQSVISEF